MIKPFDVIQDRYEDLASSIVVQAVDDYKRYNFVLDTIDLRDYKDEEGKTKAINLAMREVKNVEAFFGSSWFEELSGLNGSKALVALRKTYIKEYFPVRMEELMDQTKNARFRAKEGNNENF